uniref:Tc1-like transposase DDE domain-containing protein n=1 Tax=Schizaphis graminum TaxID=13262 RepID=A0A2S2NB48_SCHGA
MSFSNNNDTRSQTKQIVYKVYTFLKQLSTKPDLTADFFKNTQIRTAEACGLSGRTVRRICSEAKYNVEESTSVMVFRSPRKGYKRAKIVSELDDFDSDVVRRTVHDFYDRGEYPTPQLILNALRQKINYSGCLRSMQYLLKNLKFSYKKCYDGRKFLMEKNYIVALRCKFLREICALREMKDDRPIVYIDGTWVNQNHSESMIRQNEHGTKGLKVPTGKGGRLIVYHAGCARYGFIQGAKLVFRSNILGNTIDYHSQMNAQIFENWFIELLNNLEEPSVLVMDNTSYHSTLVENHPKSNWRKLDVQKWLSEKNIEFHQFETLPELHQKVKALIPRKKKYLLDQIALEKNHKVIRLPPRHCQYNAIGLIWAQVKRRIAKNNNTFKMVDIERLTHEALDAVTKEDWENCVRHVEKLQESDNRKEILRDALMEPVVLTILPDDSDCSDEESDIEQLE